MANKPLNTAILDRAIIFAVRAHTGTERRGKGFPYIVHPMEAVEIVATMTKDQELLAAAALHDTLEDTNITLDQLRDKFGDRIASHDAKIAYCDTMEHGIHVTQNFLTATGCQTMDELMKLTTEEIVDAYLKAGAIDKNCLLGFANFPLLDGQPLHRQIRMEEVHG